MPRQPARQPRRRGVAIALMGIVAVTALAGSAEVARRAIDGVEENRTVTAFYLAPPTHPQVAPGTILRREPLPSAPAGARAWRILYASTDVFGAPIVVSGIVIAPSGPPPPGGRPIVAWGHPTTGAAQKCAPSLGDDPFLGIEGMHALLDLGYVVAATDYSGMGTPGPDSYLIGRTEGNNVLDAARAARTIEASGAGDDLLLWGHSQGGHAALFAAETAREYAPELQLRAIAVAAPATRLAELLDADIGDVGGITIASYAFTAYQAVYGPTVPGTQLSDILSPAGVAAVPRMYGECLLTQNRALHGQAGPLVGSFLDGDPATTEPWAGLLAANTPGSVGLTVPLLVVQGEADTLVRPSTTAAFVGEERAHGTDVTFVSIPDADHGDIAYAGLPRVLLFFQSLR